MDFSRVTPESVGISSQAILNTLDAMDALGVEMHGIMLVRHGKVCAEGYWKPYNKKTPHIMFSFTKSLVSTAIGFARQEGLLSLDEKLVDLFPGKLPEHPSENLKKCQIYHLLVMGCGHETEPQIQRNPDWISAFLAHPFVYEPGTHFLYNSAGTNLLCAILQKKTGQTLTEYLNPRLFEPLGIKDVYCHALPDGTQMGGGGSYLTLEDMARFAQFVLNKGAWEGKQLLNSGWFEEATACHIDSSSNDTGPDWQAGYCYQYWRCRPQGVFRADGAFGQFGFMFTKQDALLLIQSASLRTQDELSAIWENLFPGMADTPLPENPTAFDQLRRRLNALELHPVLGVRNPGAEASLEKTVYTAKGTLPDLLDLAGGVGQFETHANHMKSLRFFSHEDDLWLHCQQEQGSLEIPLGMNGHFVSFAEQGVTYGTNSRWRAPNKLEIEFRCASYASGRRLVFCFEKDALTLTADSTLPVVSGLSGPEIPVCRFTIQTGDLNTKTKMYWES